MPSLMPTEVVAPGAHAVVLATGAVPVRLPGDGPDGRQTVKRTFKTF